MNHFSWILVFSASILASPFYNLYNFLARFWRFFRQRCLFMWVTWSHWLFVFRRIFTFCFFVADLTVCWYHSSDHSVSQTHSYGKLCRLVTRTCVVCVAVSEWSLVRIDNTSVVQWSEGVWPGWWTDVQSLSRSVSKEKEIATSKI